MNQLYLRIPRKASITMVAAIVAVLIPVISWGVYQQNATATTRLQKLYDVGGLIDLHYVDGLSEELNAILEKSLNEMLSHLDQHSRLYSREEYNALNEYYRGNYEGIGTAFRIINDMFVILEPMPGGPAETAGLAPGDVITQIDGTAASPITAEEVRNRVRGPQGTTVTLTVQRRGATPRDVTVQRGKIDVRAISQTTMLDDTTGYIGLSAFTNNTERQVGEAIQELRQLGMERLIFDLRNNGGGLMNQATALADFFLDQGRVIWKTQGRNKNYTAEGRSENPPLLPPTMPIIVLVNGESASASEIVAGALQDWDRALILGSETYGKALVQNQFLMKDGGALFLTTARYTTPTGRSIQIERNRDGDVMNTARAPQEFQTLRTGRTVMSRGGITPEIATTPLGISAGAGYLHVNHTTYEFALEWAIQHPSIGNQSLHNFIATVQVDDALLDDFALFILHHPILQKPGPNPLNLWATPPTTVGEIRKHPTWQQEIEKDMRILLKADLAEAIWGSTGHSAHLLSVDPEIAQAIAQFSNAAPPVTYQHR